MAKPGRTIARFCHQVVRDHLVELDLNPPLYLPETSSGQALQGGDFIRSCFLFIKNVVFLGKIQKSCNNPLLGGGGVGQEDSLKISEKRLVMSSIIITIPCIIMWSRTIS
jgi:hypothetical protein